MKLMLAIPTYDGKIGIKSAFEFASFSLVLKKLDIGLELAQVSGCGIVSKAKNFLENNTIIFNIVKKHCGQSNDRQS